MFFDDVYAGSMGEMFSETEEQLDDQKWAAQGASAAAMTSNVMIDAATGAAVVAAPAASGRPNTQKLILWGVGLLLVAKILGR